MDRHRGIDWLLQKLLPIVGSWSVVGLMVGQSVWRRGNSSAATLTLTLLEHVILFGGAALLNELATRAFLDRMVARATATATAPSQSFLTLVGLAGGALPLCSLGALFLALGAPTPLHWLAIAAIGTSAVGASSAFTAVSEAYRARRRLEVEALGALPDVEGS